MRPPLTAAGFLRRIGCAAAILLLVLARPAAVTAATYAVVAGVNDYPNGNWLPSCTNDAVAIVRFLKEAGGIPATNITLLLDGQATGPAIEKAIRERFSKATAKDEVFFYFSGHGTVIPNWEKKGQDIVMKALVPHGLDPSTDHRKKLLTQEQLQKLLFGTKAGHVVVVLDTCFSGTRTRSVSPDPARKVKVMDIGWGPAEVNLSEPESNPPATQSQTRGPKPAITWTWLGACGSKQASYAGKPTSEFTTQLLAELMRAPGAAVSNFFPKLSKTVEIATSGRHHGVQVPDAEGNLERPLLAALANAAPALAASTPPAPSPAPVPVVTPVIAPAPAPPQVVTATAATPTAEPVERRDFELLVELNQARFVKDEKLVVSVQPAHDCYLRLYLMSPTIKDIQQIFPNGFQQDNKLKAGQKVRVPSGQAEFQFTMEGPWGTETIIAVASTEQFDDLVKPTYDKATGLFKLGDETPGGTLTRGIRVERKPEAPVGGKANAAPPASAPKVSIRMVYYQVKETRAP